MKPPDLSGHASASSSASFEAKTVSALVPLANMFQYVSTLRSMSKGRANYSMQLASYETVPPNVEKEIMAKNAGKMKSDA